jgi:hypothetical protein
MGVNVKTKTIDGRRFEFFPMPAPRSIKVLTRLIKIIGEPAGVLASDYSDQKPKSIMEYQLDESMISKAIGALTERLDEDIVLDTIHEIIRPVFVDGRRILFEQDFDGRIGHLFKVLFAALEANYSDFFDGSIGGLGSLLQRVQPPVDTTQATQA